MSELKRDIGCGITVSWNPRIEKIVLETAHNYIRLADEQVKNLIAFHSYIQTELASRQRLEPLPVEPPASPDMMTL